MRWERGFLLVTVSHEVERNSNWPANISKVDICRRDGMDEWRCLHFEECDQRGAAMEGIEDSSWGRPRRKTGNDDEKG